MPVSGGTGDSPAMPGFMRGRSPLSGVFITEASAGRTGFWVEERKETEDKPGPPPPCTRGDLGPDPKHSTNT